MAAYLHPGLDLRAPVAIHQHVQATTIQEQAPTEPAAEVQADPTNTRTSEARQSRNVPVPKRQTAEHIVSLLKSLVEIPLVSNTQERRKGILNRTVVLLTIPLLSR